MVDAEIWWFCAAEPHKTTKFRTPPRFTGVIPTHQAELEKLGIHSLALFGSVARDEARAESDVDLLVELEPPFTFDPYIKAKFYLEDVLQCPVDLVMQETLKPRARDSAQREAIRVA